MLKRFLVLFFLSSSLALNLPSLKVVDESPKPLVSSNQTTCPTCLQIKSNTAVQNYYPWLFNNARYSLENEALHIRIIEDTEDSDSWIEWKIFVLIFHHSIFRFMYSRTDDRGWPVYQYFDNSQQRTLWLHFYDEGLFYDGFYVVNDLEVRKQYWI